MTSPRPTPGAPGPWRFPPFTRHRSAGGLDVVVCHVPGRPITAVRLVLHAGAAIEARAAHGLHALMAAALPQATASRDHGQLSDALELLGADLAVDASLDTTTIAMTFPAPMLAAAVALFAEVVRRPAFAAVDVERVRQKMLADLEHEERDPTRIAARAWPSAVFAPASPYARPISGERDVIAALERDALIIAYQRLLDHVPATLIVVGDVQALDPEGIAGQLGDFPANEPLVIAPNAARREGRRLLLIDYPGAVQSVIRIGHDGPPKLVDDPAALDIVETCLGGAFVSRLNLKLREEKGYTYGAHAAFNRLRDGGFFTAATGVQSDATAPAIADTVAEITRMHDEGVAGEELAIMREMRVGKFTTRFERAESIAAELAEIAVHGLPDDYPDRLRAELQTVPEDRVLAAARASLNLDHLTMLVVGDADRIKGDLAGLDFGPVELLPR